MVYIFLAEGFEEIEALATADILKRAGIEVYLVSADNTKSVTGAHKISVDADVMINNISYDFDMVVLPGGSPGYINLEGNKDVKKAVEFAANNNRYIAAICAAPSVIGKWGYLNGKKAVCYPSFEKYLIGADVLFDDVAVDGKLITSRGAGTAHKFAFKIVEILKDKETADSVNSSMLY